MLLVPRETYEPYVRVSFSQPHEADKQKPGHAKEDKGRQAGISLGKYASNLVPTLSWHNAQKGNCLGHVGR